jgi:hypothetical protein
VYSIFPLSVTKLPKSALQTLANMMGDTLPTWKGKLINWSGRLTLIKTTLSAMPVHMTISLDLPAWLLKAMTKTMKAFLWTSRVASA